MTIIHDDTLHEKNEPLEKAPFLKPRTFFFIQRCLLIFIVSFSIFILDLKVKDWVSNNFATSDPFLTHKIYRTISEEDHHKTLEQFINDNFIHHSDDERKEILNSVERFDGRPIRASDRVEFGTTLLITKCRLSLFYNTLEIRYTRNEGTAFGLIPSYEEQRRRLKESHEWGRSEKRLLISLLVILFVLITTSVMFYMTQPNVKTFHRNDKNSHYAKYYYIIDIGLGLFAGGGLANAWDRLYTGFVVDYIYIKIITFPTFNIADLSLTIGFLMVLFGAWMIIEKEPTNIEQN